MTCYGTLGWDKLYSPGNMKGTQVLAIYENWRPVSFIFFTTGSPSVQDTLVLQCVQVFLELHISVSRRNFLWVPWLLVYLQLLCDSDFKIVKLVVMGQS